MTTIAAFTTISHHSQKLYVMSDSRVTWTINGAVQTHFDNSTKIFPFTKSGDVLAYCGDSLFSLSVMARIKIQLEFSLRFRHAKSALEKRDLILSFLNNGVASYPRHLLDVDTTLLYFTAIDKKFFGWKFTLNAGYLFEDTVIDISPTSGIIAIEGSGAKLYTSCKKMHVEKYTENSSSILFSFVNHLKSNADPKTGGPPQLVQLDAEGKVKPIGIVDDGKINMMGEINDFWRFEPKIELRSIRFEMINNETMEIMSGQADRSHMEFQRAIK